MGEAVKILITGAGGFIAKNLIAALQSEDTYEILQYHSNMGDDILKKFCAECQFVFHLAGVNRPKNKEEYESGNYGFTQKLVQFLEEKHNVCPVVYASSKQAALDNDYGRSKKMAETVLFHHRHTIGSPMMIYRLPNVFGKWCRPDYNSAIATFCYNLSRGIPIQISDAAHEMELVYIDDVLDEFFRAMVGQPYYQDVFCSIPIIYKKSLGEIATTLRSFVRCRETLSIPDQSDEWIKKLYSTYLSYLPEDKFSYDLIMHKDNRGSFTEFIRTLGQGQFSVNISKPHILKGNHWHHSKHEKFLVVSGRGVIRFRKIGTKSIIEYNVSGERLEVVDIPPGYTHNIENLGDGDMVTLMWANENFDSKHPDTFFLEV